MRNQPITAVIVGAGHRAFVYSKLALTDPDKLKIVGVATRTKFDKKKQWKCSVFQKRTALTRHLSSPEFLNLQTP